MKEQLTMPTVQQEGDVYDAKQKLVVGWTGRLFANGTPVGQAMDIGRGFWQNPMTMPEVIAQQTTFDAVNRGLNKKPDLCGKPSRKGK